MEPFLARVVSRDGGNYHLKTVRKGNSMVVPGPQDYHWDGGEIYVVVTPSHEDGAITYAVSHEEAADCPVELFVSKVGELMVTTVSKRVRPFDTRRDTQWLAETRFVASTIIDVAPVAAS